MFVSVIVLVIVRMIMLVVVTMFVIVPVIVTTAGLVMRMTMMRVAFMRVAFMRVIVMRMIVMRMTMMRMIVPGVVMCGLGRFISAGVGLEGRLDMAHLRAEATHHVLQHMVATDAQAIGEDLRRGMAIADVIGDAGELARVSATRLRQLLGRGDDFDQPPVLQHQRVAAAQNHGVRQVEQEFGSARRLHRHAAAMPAFVIQHDRVGRRGAPGALGGDEIRTDHDRFLIGSPLRSGRGAGWRARSALRTGRAQYMK